MEKDKTSNNSWKQMFGSYHREAIVTTCRVILGISLESDFSVIV